MRKSPLPSDSSVQSWLQRTDAAPLQRNIRLKQAWLEKSPKDRFDARYVRDSALILAEVDTQRVPLNAPVRLAPVHIPKPWGEEIWFTGIEARGEASVVCEDGSGMPLSRYLALAPTLSGAPLPPTLLKILNPKPEPVRGDLYFEVHERKREVYIVTHVDAQAWPDGSGAIRFGMAQEKRREIGDDQAFRAAYQDVVQAYERVRRRIDEGDQSLAAARLEATRREQMDAFTNMRSLQPGDVVQVPVLTPHALQHGVRVVEFQTAVYERLIVSFAQKVLTQVHWDTQDAVSKMNIEAPAPEQFEPVTDGIVRIARFDDFGVWRMTKGNTLPVSENVPYILAMAISGTATLSAHGSSLTIHHEQASFVPHAALAGLALHLHSGAQLLLAAPGL